MKIKVDEKLIEEYRNIESELFPQEKTLASLREQLLSRKVIQNDYANKIKCVSQ